MAQGARKLAEGVESIIRTIVHGPTMVPNGKGSGARGTVWMLGSSYDVGDESVSAAAELFTLYGIRVATSLSAARSTWTRQF